MAQIIECPACSTRYKINKAIPEGGRSVKCARCAHQWKLTPADALPDEDEVEENAAAHAEQQWSARDEAAGAEQDTPESAYADDVSDEYHAHFHEDAEAYEEGGQASVDQEDWGSPPDDASAVMSSLNQPVTEASGEPEGDPAEMAGSEAEANRQGKRSWWQRGQPSSGPDAASGHAYPIPSGAYEVPSEAIDDDADAFEQEAAPQEAGDQPQSPPVGDDSWSSRFMGPGWRGRKEPPPVEEEEDEDPETVIRETFRSALDRNEEEEQAVAAANAAAQAESSSPFGSIYDAEWNRTDDEEEIRQAAPDQFVAPLHDEPGIGEAGSADYYPEEDGVDDDAPAFLRRGLGAGEPEPDEIYQSEPQDYDALADEEDLDRAPIARFGAPGSRPQPFGMDEGRDEFGDDQDGIANPEEPRDYDSLYDDEFEGMVERRVDENDLDEALVGLGEDDQQDRLDQDYEPSEQGRSGLAVAAGWVAYLSLMGGLLLGTINFRQDVMAALPGTVNMYRMLGYDVALNKVDFASVDYQWSQIEGSPAIELKGQVVNVTDDTVKVPPVMVNVQSTSGAPLKAEASVPTDELGPRDSATFTLELVAPPEDVTRIELEFAPGG